VRFFRYIHKYNEDLSTVYITEMCNSVTCHCKYCCMICRETSQEMQLKYHELSTLYQALSVERDRLSELVKVLEKR